MQYVYRCARHRYGLQECTVRIELLFTGFQFLSQATLASSLLGPFSPPPPPHCFLPSCRSLLGTQQGPPPLQSAAAPAHSTVSATHGEVVPFCLLLFIIFLCVLLFNPSRLYLLTLWIVINILSDFHPGPDEDANEDAEF